MLIWPLNATFAIAVEGSADAGETVPVAASTASAASAVPSETTPANASAAVQSTGDDAFTTQDIITEIEE